MNFNIDIVIILAFLAINLFVGLYTGRGIKNIKEYAIANRNFSTPALTATIVATWISGSTFAVGISETYQNGLWYLSALLGNVLYLLIEGWVLGPRMKEFFGKLSVAEVMGDLNGNKVRLITSIAALAQAVGMTALQIKVFSTIFSHFFGIESMYAVFISSFVVIVYSAFGGIKAVTFTDAVQFIAFGVFIPMFAIFLWQAFGSKELIINTLQTNPNFNVSKVFDIHNVKFWEYFCLFIYFAIPGSSSTIFQRSLMAKNVKQIRTSFTAAAIIVLFIRVFVCFCGIVILSYNPNLDPNNVAMYIIDNYTFSGLKGFAIVGIMAMIMSTADSWINTGSVIFVNDFCKSIGIKINNELLLTRFLAIAIGIGAIFLALSATNLLKLLLLQANFYKPIVTIPLLFAILGFRTSARAVLTGMFAGFVTVVIWRTFIQPSLGVDSLVPAMLANIIFLLAAHYGLGEPGGWIGTKNVALLKEMEFQRKYQKQMRQKFLSNMFNNLLHPNFVRYCAVNSPKESMTYTAYGVFSIISIMLSIFLLDKATYQFYANTINLIEAGTLFIGTGLICNALWSESIRVKYLGFVWHIAVFITLAFASSFLVIISHFAETNLIIYVLNLVMISLLIKWQIALPMIIIGASSAAIYHQLYLGDIDTNIDAYDLKLRISYILLMISAMVVVFFKPKQDQQALEILRSSHLDGQLRQYKEELIKSLELKNEFLNNLNHEVRTPITGITSLGEVLYDNYYKLNDEKRYHLAKTIADSSDRLITLMNNILDLSNLSSLQTKLDIRETNLSNLVDERIREGCQINQKSEQFELVIDVEPDITAECDPYYIQQVFDNLINNAIQYSNEGTIIITLKKTASNSQIEFSIADQGLGIPKEELIEIFEPFTIGSKTRNMAGGRGIGLALCKKVIELHQGRIWADNNQDKGSVFTFVLPIRYSKVTQGIIDKSFV
ncbi:sodium:solute symporter family transporter [Rickettsiales endosymbiont of Stachyamoeba lipophora]|uniref:sodium:solute symporter family transporter n=1 Tax=Rickettsiales endosymbiont of Stachyamoeba lipophora TaxID=2486578 RepID=UPI000F64E884|nr:ATP-binding protein [Rickettsiales endosymbiont of Stachyamoeba lipophora]AZL15256.1 sodium:solute symporter family protein [Rickettsiales endosymbiont of Stachyamoeba lipophora]